MEQCGVARNSPLKARRADDGTRTRGSSHLYVRRVAAYDDRAVGTQVGGALRRPVSERSPDNKRQAVSFAAYRALVDVWPNDTNSVYRPLLKELGYDPDDKSTDIETVCGNRKCGLRRSD